MSFFDSMQLIPEDPIFGLTKQFKADPRPQKVNLGIGTYHEATGHPYILTTVKVAEQVIFQKENPKNYLPIDGNPEYIQETQKLIFGQDNSRIAAGEVFGAQTVGGTCALRIGGDFLMQSNCKTIYLSNPTWSNHLQIFARSGMQIEYYNYYDEKNQRVDFAGFCAAVKTMKPGQAILLQPCCHNPTGVDLSFSQWQELSALIKQQKIIPFFDLAYQGFGQDVEQDAKPIRYFADQGHEMLVSYSYSKNLGLYGERIGFFAIFTKTPKNTTEVASHIKQIIRSNYSNPPRFGALIVTTILKSKELNAGWKRELHSMKSRIEEMREALAFGLMSQDHGMDFSFLTEQKGMFSLTGLNREQIQRLRDDYAIYLIGNGRINVAGLNPTNIDYVIHSMLEILNNQVCNIINTRRPE